MFSDDTSIFALTILSMNLVICLPLMIYFGYTFYKRSKNRVTEDNVTFFNRRHPSTIYATITFCILFVSIERPLNILIYQLNIIDLLMNTVMLTIHFNFLALHYLHMVYILHFYKDFGWYFILINII